MNNKRFELDTLKNADGKDGFISVEVFKNHVEVEVQDTPDNYSMLISISNKNAILLAKYILNKCMFDR